MKMIFFLIGWICLANTGFSQVSNDIAYRYYKKFVTDNKDDFEGYAFICDSLGSQDDMADIIKTISDKELPVSKTVNDKYLVVNLDSIVKVSGLKLSILSKQKFYNLPNRINSGITEEEGNLSIELNRLHNLVMTDEKNKDYYIRKMDSITNSPAFKSSNRKAKNSQKRLLIFLPPVIRENNIVIAGINYNNIADSFAFYKVYTLSTNKKK